MSSGVRKAGILSGRSAGRGCALGPWMRMTSHPLRMSRGRSEAGLKAVDVKLTRLKPQPTFPSFAVYDGWELMVFRDISPYLIDAYGSIKDEYQARGFLLRLKNFLIKTKRTC